MREILQFHILRTCIILSSWTHHCKVPHSWHADKVHHSIMNEKQLLTLWCNGLDAKLLPTVEWKHLTAFKIQCAKRRVMCRWRVSLEGNQTSDIPYIFNAASHHRHKRHWDVYSATGCIKLHLCVQLRVLLRHISVPMCPTLSHKGAFVLKNTSSF